LQVDNELYNNGAITEADAGQQFLQRLVRYFRLVLRYRLIVIGFVAAAAAIGFIRFKRTPNLYQASASMMIRHVSTGTGTSKENAKATQGLLASYKALLLSDNVLQKTVAKLEKLPPELSRTESSLRPKVLRSILTVDFEPKEHVVELSCKSRDPEATVNVIRALGDASAEFIQEDSRGMSFEREQNLERELEKLEGILASRQRQLLENKRASGEISMLDDTKSHPVLTRVNDLGVQLTTARSRRVELEAMGHTVHELATAGKDLSPALPLLEEIVGAETLRQVPGLSGVSQNTISSIQTELQNVESELQVLRRHYGSRHSKIMRSETLRQNLQQRLDAAQQSNRNKFAGGFYDPQIAAWMVNTLHGEYQQSVRHEQLVQGQYDIAKQEAIELNTRLADVSLAERELRSLEERHSSVLKRLNSIEIGPANSSFRVAALNEPILPRSPVSPILTRLLAVSVAIGLLMSLCAIYIIDLIDDRLRSPEDVQTQLALPILGVVRPLPEDETDANIYVHSHPLSVQTECFRTIRTAISLSESDTRCIAITSSEQSEGKTTLTSNLAATFAQTGSRTLLIDADMRRPGLSKLLQIRGNGGLSEILRANENIPEMCRERITETEVDGLHVLPCGPRMMNAGVLLSMPSLAAIIDWAVSEYDQVMIDCPPTLPVSDAAIVGNYVDGMVFLLNPDKTHRRNALRAVEQLRSVGMNLLGVVTNTADESHDGAYGYGYGYGYGKEYTYGQNDDEDEITSVKFESISPPKKSGGYSLLSRPAKGDDNDGTERNAA